MGFEDDVVALVRRRLGAVAAEDDAQIGRDEEAAGGDVAEGAAGSVPVPVRQSAGRLARHP